MHIKLKDFPELYPVGLHMDCAIKYINTTSRLLKKHFREIGETRTDIDIYCSGSSGAILGALMVLKLKANFNIEIQHVKKVGESSHHGNYNLAYREKSIKIVLDDFISTGTTVEHITDAVIKNNRRIIEEDTNLFDYCIVLNGFYLLGYPTEELFKHYIAEN